MNDKSDWCIEGTLKDHRIIRQLRSGARTTSYLAKDSEGNRICLTYLDTEKLKERFKFREHVETSGADAGRETLHQWIERCQDEMKEYAKRTKGLGSEHVAILYDIGLDRDKEELVLVSEHCPGVDFYYATRRLSPLHMISLFVQALEGLRYIHDCGFLHLNIKPARLIVDIEGVPPIVKFTDFGFAIPIQGYSGDFSGTPSYMAPEVVLGQRNKIDARADLYSFAVLVYLCLTEREPFENRYDAQHDRAKLRHIVSKEGVVSPPAHFSREIPPELDKIAAGLLDSDPDARPYSSADDLINAFYENWPDESKTMPTKKTTTFFE